MQADTGQGAHASAPAVLRAAAILEELAHNREPITLSELSRRLGLAKSSVAHICAALVSTGLIQRNLTGYTLGRRLAELGSAYLRTVDHVQEFRESCSVHAIDVEDTLQFATLDDGLEVMYLARRDGSSPVRLASEVGQRLPANCTAVGKAMLASLPGAELERRLTAVSELPAMTASSIVKKADLREELNKVRTRGYAVDDEETLQGVLCVAVCLPTSSSAAVRRAVSATMLKAQVSPSRIEKVLGSILAVIRGMGFALDSEPLTGPG